MLKTRQKISIARLGYLTLVFIFAVLRRPLVQTVKRRGINWNLELSEAIDLMIFLQGSFEPTTTRAYEKIVHPGDVVLDLGANIGAHTLPLAKLVGPTGRIFAFEPTNYAFTKLQKNLKLNPELANRITASQMMLVSDAALVTRLPKICSSWPLDSANDLHPKHCGKFMSTEGATISSLDDFLESQAAVKIAFIKLDVDGFELQILTGARKMLIRDRPTILMELSPYLMDEYQQSFETMIEFLAELGYVFSDVDSGKAFVPNAASIRKRIPDGATRNVILTRS